MFEEPGPEPRGMRDQACGIYMAEEARYKPPPRRAHSGCIVGPFGKLCGPDLHGRGEVQSPDMTNQVISFPRTAPVLPQPEVSSGKRILICIGKQRVALDICCQATILNSPTAHASVAVIASAGSGDSRRKPKS
jgi:hypothetical protein